MRGFYFAVGEGAFRDGKFAELSDAPIKGLSSDKTDLG